MILKESEVALILHHLVKNIIEIEYLKRGFFFDPRVPPRVYLVNELK